VRFTALVVSTLAVTTMLPSAQAQELPQLDVVLPGQRLVINSRAIAFEYADRSHLITAAAGDTQIVFVTEPLNQRLAVLDASLAARSAKCPRLQGAFSSRSRWEQQHRGDW